MNVNTDSLFSVRNAAKKLGVARMTLYRWIDEKKIQAVEIDGKSYIEKRVLEAAKSNPFARTKEKEILC